MTFREIVAEYEADLVRTACRAEGFDAALSDRIMVRHRADPSGLDLAEHYAAGVGHYVRSLAGVPPGPARP